METIGSNPLCPAMRAKIIEANEVGGLDENQKLAMESAIEDIARADHSSFKKLHEKIKELGLYHIRSRGTLIIAIRKMKHSS